MPRAHPLPIGFSPNTAAVSHWSLLAGFTAALAGAFWSYDGWGTVAYIGDEVREPEKNLPRAILLGSFCFITLYLLINLAYLYVLPVQQMGSAAEDRVASLMISKVMGPRGAVVIAALVLLCTFDAVNSSLLTCGRVFFAMAREGLFLKSVAEVHPRFGNTLPRTFSISVPGV